VIKSRPVEKSTAELYYHLAGIHQTKGNSEVARNIFQQLLNFDIGYKDVEEKLEELGGRTAVPGKAATMPGKEADFEWEVEMPEGAAPAAAIVGVMDGFDFMQKIPLFADMPLQEMKAFYNISEERKFQDGERLIEQGRPGMALYVIRSGKVSIHLGSRGGQGERGGFRGVQGSLSALPSGQRQVCRPGAAGFRPDIVRPPAGDHVQACHPMRRRDEKGDSDSFRSGRLLPGGSLR
jgi:hypothetical protein